MNTTQKWQDQYINHCENRFICFDERGEFINTAKTLTQAQAIITKYVLKHTRGNK